jgi:7,8-dihydropterin-6-yl-methyl-4-(beta-D-ribofuranosyl)aminobenzene 5'-phosphate synthase
LRENKDLNTFQPIASTDILPAQANTADAMILAISAAAPVKIISVNGNTFTVSKSAGPLIPYNVQYGWVMLMLKVKVLVDNNTLIDRYLTGEPGFCLWLETETQKILFDTGYSDIFISNAQLLGLDPADADKIILSHGHNDHTWGLNHLIQYYDRRLIKHKPELIAHPQVFERKRAEGLEIGIVLSREVLDEFFIPILSAGPLKIADRLIWLGEIPRLFEKEKSLGKRFRDGIEYDDFCHDDSALVYEGTDGLVIMTGCSHSGICNIVEYAMEVTGKQKVLDVIGGFHMQNAGVAAVDYTIEKLKEISPVTIHPCHCTDLKAKIALGKALNIEEVGVGLELNFD